MSVSVDVAQVAAASMIDALTSVAQIKTVEAATEAAAILEAEKIVETKSAVKAEFLDNCVRVEFDHGYKKLLEYDDFDEVFRNMMGKVKTVEKSVEYNLSWPANVIWSSVSATRIKLTCFYPGGIRNVDYRGTSLPRVTPSILISHTLDAKPGSAGGWRVYEPLFFGTELPSSRIERKYYAAPSTATGIYLLPFANMYDNGRMCLGSNHLPLNLEKGDLRPLNAYYHVIFNSPFNQDLGVKALSPDSRYASTDSWFKYLADLAKEPNPRFPFQELRGYVAGNHAGTPVPSANIPRDDDF